jgi:4-hydroxy-3-methylbut-2-enyl diphosphate reductase
MGAAAYLIDGAHEIQQAWVKNSRQVGITAGASAPEVLVKQVVERLIALGGETPGELPGVEENIVFSMPRELRIPAREI